MDKLHDLIHALTPSEKAFVKNKSIALNTHKELLLPVFEAHLKLKTFDPQKLATKLEDKKIIRKLPQIKEDLYVLILDSLNEFHKDDVKSIQIAQLVNSARILIKKELYMQAENALNQAKKMAYAFDDTGSLIHIYQLYFKLFCLGHGGKEFQFEKELDRIIIQTNQIHQIIQLRTELTNLFFEGKVDSYRYKGLIRILLTQIDESFDFSNLNPTSRWDILESKSLAYYLVKEEDRYLSNKALQQEFLENQPHLLEGDQTLYIRNLGSLISVFLARSEYDMAIKALRKLKEFPTSKNVSLKPEFLKYSTYYSHQLNYLYLTKQFKKGYDLLTQAATWFKNNQSQIKNQQKVKFLELFYLLAFGAKDYKSSLNFQVQLSRFPSTESEDMNHGLMALVTLIELGELKKAAKKAGQYLEDIQELGLDAPIHQTAFALIMESEKEKELPQSFYIILKEKIFIIAGAFEIPFQDNLAFFYLWVNSKIHKVGLEGSNSNGFH